MSVKAALPTPSADLDSTPIKKRVQRALMQPPVVGKRHNTGTVKRALKEPGASKKSYYAGKTPRKAM